MAHYFLFPEKDATIYAHPINQSLNTGIDEILTLRDESSITDNNYYPSRILIQFKDSEINNVYNNVIGSSNKNLVTASLKLFQTEHRELSLDQHLEVYPLAESWENGRGRLGNTPQITDGVSWIYRDASDNAVGSVSLYGTKWATGSLPTGTTGSWISTAQGGGIWYTGSDFESNRTYSYNEELDISIDVTSQVLKHYSSSNDSATYPVGITNNGFIIKRSGSQEFTAINDGELNFFSMDTHTIYPPYLDLAWDDSVYDTGSATSDTILNSGEIYVTLRNNKGEFKTIEEPKFRLNVRELYPTRAFVTTSNYLNVKHFTSESYYSLVDYATEETVIPFGPTSKLSADSEGMYFKLYMNGLEEERYYKLLFKHQNNDGITVFDDDYYFKIVKS